MTNKKMDTENKPEITIEIRRPLIQTVRLRIIGDSPLIVHAWGEKSKREMLEAQQKKSKDKKAREARNPVSEWINAAYWLSGKPKETGNEDKDWAAVQDAIKNGAKFGFPATSIKSASITAAFREGYSKNKVSLQGTIFVEGTESKEMVTINGIPEWREDIVRIGTMTRVPESRFRPIFNEWSADLNVRWNRNGLCTLEQIINMINIGGFSVGIGEWRIEKGGMYGAYHVDENSMMII